MQEDDLSSQNNRPERIVYIDVARGIAALLVVIGHSIQVADSTFDENILFRMIYSFHMPLFMFLSGYVSYKSEYFDRLWIIKKAKHLVVPFLVWTVLPVLFSGNSGDMFGKLYMAIKQPDVSYWFLLILFYCDVLLFAQNEIENALNKCIFKLNKPNAIINEALTNNFFGGGIANHGNYFFGKDKFIFIP